jgi:GNAT superfamily N-acetyltransferase
MTVRAIRADETRAAAAVLGRAFEADPVMAWMLGATGPALVARLARFHALLIERVYLRHGLVFADDAFRGAAVWTPPGAWRLGLLDQARLAGPMISIARGAILRMLRASTLTEREHLHEPHYYLFAIGTDPAAQGTGVGAALMVPVLARCDRERLPAYLESSNPRNHTFYRRHGFEPIGEIELDAGVKLVRMRREPA